MIERCLRPALPMNRAVLHRLGLSVGIAIALCGCSQKPEPPVDPPHTLHIFGAKWGHSDGSCDFFRGLDWADWIGPGTQEITAVRYSEVLQAAKCEPFLRPTIRNALANGKIDYLKYDQIVRTELDYRDQAMARMDAVVSNDLKQEIRKAVK